MLNHHLLSGSKMLKLFQQGCGGLESFSKLNRALPLVNGRCRYSTSPVTSQEQPTTRREKETVDPPPASQSPEEETEAGGSSSPHFEEEFLRQKQQEQAKQHRTVYKNEQEETFAPFRYIYPEFLPHPELKARNRICEKLERMDMLRRRSQIDIPEFYVGSILSLTVSDRNAPGKTTTFVGICTERDYTGLRSTLTLRNVVDGHGVEITYDLYNPTILNITCLRLEKRLDENLRYLRDAPPEYSTFPFDMVPELRNPDAPVPINPIKVKLNPRPWVAEWHLWDLKGIVDINESHPIEDWRQTRFDRHMLQTGRATQHFDLMKTYRESIPAEEQTEIYSEVHQQLAKLTATLRKQKKKRTFVKPTKTV